MQNFERLQSIDSNDEIQFKPILYQTNDALRLCLQTVCLHV